MAIQIRRGASEDFDASKMVAGELGVATDGSHKMWATGQAGDSWELASKEDLDTEVEARETLAETVEAQGESLEGKAEVDGMYNDLYAGGLTTDKAQEDKIPYLFRKTGGTLSRVGERCYDTLIGASVGENQLINATSLVSGTNNGITVTADTTTGEITVSGTATANATIVVLDVLEVKNGHAYYLSQPQGASGNTFWLRTGENTFWNYKQIGKSTDATVTSNLRVYVASGQTVNFKIKPQFIDLTAELGSAIADYIYSLEYATAGSGIAKLRSWGFLRGYQAYNAGSIESVEVTEKKVVGFNQWNEEWEVGGYNGSNGSKINEAGKIRSKNYIKVCPNETYYFKPPAGIAGLNVYRYDSDKEFIILNEVGDTQNHLLTIPANTEYITFSTFGSSLTTYNHDICINISSSRNGEYEPYTSTTYALGSDKLRGLFKLDANNNLYADGDVKTSDGTITRKYSLVDLGTQTWTKSIDGVFTTTGLVGQVKEPATYNANPNLVCSKYISASYAELWSDAKDKTVTVIWSASGSHGQVWVRDSAFTDASAFATAMSGIYLVYPLATETTEQGDPFPSPQVCYPDGTEEYLTGNGVPVGHETEYPYDLKGLVEELIDVPDVPSTNGTYVLKATRSASGITYTWVADSAISSLASPLMSASPQTTTETQESTSDEQEEEGETTR